MIDDINVLIQRYVEHGFKKFYDDLEVFYRKLDGVKDHDKNQQFQSRAITMDNIWIYVYIFVGANCMNFLIFFAEILYFHREKIIRVIQRRYVKYRAYIRRQWRNIRNKIATMIERMRAGMRVAKKFCVRRE